MDDKIRNRPSGTPSAFGGRPTLKTIAFMTGLGVTTVSRALKDAPDIGAETKERVRLVARQIGYQPNRAGVRLRTGKTNVISLILSLEEEIMGLTSPIVIGISQVLADTQYHLIITPYNPARDALIPVQYVLDTGAADGVIISRTQPKDPRVALMMEHNLPFVTHGRTEMGLVHPYFDFDNESFAYEAVKRLRARGRTRIALLQPSSHLTFHFHMRAGFEKGLRDFGGESVSFNAVNTDNSLTDIRNAFEALMRGPNPPDGIISGSGSGAIPLLAGLEATGRQLGREADLVSKEPTNILAWLHPEIITISEDFKLAGRELAKAVIARIEGVPAEQLQNLDRPR
ncbi:LacI family transcriptional regulator [Pararhizobium sp.]|uniref:LacI family transcriptional regulator n=1 Tax=Pararhizobium sp. TaxID=1977563 RepID=UPI00271ACE48|nr:LacI family transcriptional regulator [Pararhizobium sp.]MDO9418667.1 LacI family transcriptional regulator [Pararhizobium sp.]